MCIGDFVQSVGVAIAGALIWWHQARVAGVRLCSCSAPSWAVCCGVPVCSALAWPAQATAEHVRAYLLFHWFQSCLQCRMLTRCNAPHLPSHTTGRPALVHRRPHLHLFVCHPGAVDHTRHPAVSKYTHWVPRLAAAARGMCLGDIPSAVGVGGWLGLRPMLCLQPQLPPSLLQRHFGRAHGARASRPVHQVD